MVYYVVFGFREEKTHRESWAACSVNILPPYLQNVSKNTGIQHCHGMEYGISELKLLSLSEC